MCVEFVLFVRNLGALVRATVGRHSVEQAQQVDTSPEFGGHQVERSSRAAGTKVKES
ncbi:uncharacterized protein LOC144119348 isoform X1 [Amblyomma americanum]